MRYWIKLYTEIMRDPKMGRLTDRQFRTCINLFTLAGTTDDDGKLPPLEDIAWHLRSDEASLLADLEALARVNIVEQVDDTWIVRKWAERQAKAPSDQPERIAQRVRNHRERKRNESVTTLQPGVTTPETDTDTETDTDKKREVAAGAASPAEQPQAAESKQPNNTFLLATALGQVCKMEFAPNKGRLLKEAKLLLSCTDPAPEPALLIQHYGYDGHVKEQAAWWWVTDWRGQRGEWPTPATVRETWGQWAIAPPHVTPASTNGRQPQGSPALAAVARLKQQLREAEVG